MGDVRCVLPVRDSDKLLGWDGMESEITHGVLKISKWHKMADLGRSFPGKIGWLVVSSIIFFPFFYPMCSGDGDGDGGGGDDDYDDDDDPNWRIYV